MTDNEIIKALEICAIDGNCRECPAYETYKDCMSCVLSEAVDLINRQRAEIERLKAENKILSENADTAFQDGLNEAQDLYRQQIINEVKSEAIKEFAERLVAIYENDKRYDRPHAHTLVMTLFRNIDKLVKEMIGENK